MGTDKPHQRAALEIDDFSDRLLTEVDIAARQQRSVKTLQNQRVAGGGIPFIKLGRSVRYRLSDVLAYELASRHASTSEKFGSSQLSSPERKYDE